MIADFQKYEVEANLRVETQTHPHRNPELVLNSRHLINDVFPDFASLEMRFPQKLKSTTI